MVNETTISSDQLISEYQNLVYSIAKPYRKSGLPWEDLIQEGMIGLLEAQKHFDATKQVKFSTYAVFWIKKYISIAAKIENYNGSKMIPTDSKQLENKQCGQSIIKAEKETSHERQLKLPQDMPALEEKVIRMSYEQKLPMDDICMKLGLKKEKVRQIREMALRRIRSGATLN